MKTIHWTIITMCAFCLIGFRATADVSWNESFNGGFDQTWSFNAPFGGTYTTSTVGDFLTISSPSGQADAVAGQVPESFSDVRVAGTVNVGTNTPLGNPGLIGRAMDNSNLYLLSLRFEYDEFAVGIVTNGQETDLQSVSVNVSSNSSYYLLFDLVGDNLSGKLYDHDGGSLLASVSATDTNFDSGYSGVVADNFDGAIDATYDNVSSTNLVPEPASAGIIIFGGVIIALLRKKQR